MESVKWVKPQQKFYEGFRLTTNNRLLAVIVGEK
jgi:hypothetical protein